jgi:hypothetical protein
MYSKRYAYFVEDFAGLADPHIYHIRIPSHTVSAFSDVMLGSCSWDEVDYCQRWILHKVIQKCFVGSSHHGCKIYSVIGGSQWMCWYLEALGAKIGNKCCL